MPTVFITPPSREHTASAAPSRLLHGLDLLAHTAPYCSGFFLRTLFSRCACVAHPTRVCALLHIIGPYGCVSFSPPLTRRHTRARMPPPHTLVEPRTSPVTWFAVWTRPFEQAPYGWTFYAAHCTAASVRFWQHFALRMVPNYRMLCCYHQANLPPSALLALPAAATTITTFNDGVNGSQPTRTRSSSPRAAHRRAATTLHGARFLPNSRASRSNGGMKAFSHIPHRSQFILLFISAFYCDSVDGIPRTYWRPIGRSDQYATVNPPPPASDWYALHRDSPPHTRGMLRTPARVACRLLWRRRAGLVCANRNQTNWFFSLPRILPALSIPLRFPARRPYTHSGGDGCTVAGYIFHTGIHGCSCHDDHLPGR